jgi:uncharacterized protein
MADENDPKYDADGPHYYVVFHSPGPKWVKEKRYNEQPDFMVHVKYMSDLHEKGKVLISGPFMEVEGGLNGRLAPGGMIVLRTKSLEEAARLAKDDPTVKSGMINAEVKILWVPFHG